jgi:hypothetical protein
MTDDGDLRQRAIANLMEKREFAAHLLADVLVNAFLVAIWAVTSDGALVLAHPSRSSGWGIGLVLRAWDVYGSLPGRSRSSGRWNDVADHLTKQSRSGDGRSS